MKQKTAKKEPRALPQRGIGCDAKKKVRARTAVRGGPYTSREPQGRKDKDVQCKF